MTELSKIAQNYLTDKGCTFANSHCYTEIYDSYFQKFKDENRKVYILEIGIQCGYDLLMLNEYFEGNCEIYGFDIDLSKLEVELPDNIHVSQIDATNNEQIALWENEHWNSTNNMSKLPMFDIIIDDGSHQSLDILKSLCIFHSKLANDGIYVIEDLHASYAIHALFYLAFDQLDENLSNNINMENIIDKLTYKSIHYVYNSYCAAYKPSICAILKFKK